MNLKKASSGPEVSPNSSVKAAFRTSSIMWCLHAIQRIVQQPLWTPVLKGVGGCSVEATGDNLLGYLPVV